MTHRLLLSECPTQSDARHVAYTYDPLDRLHAETNLGTEFEYVGLTSRIAVVDDGTTERFVAHDWNGTRLADWDTSDDEPRFHGTNAHHDLTFLTDDTGDVIGTQRYNPWGELTNTSGEASAFRFQGNWVDDDTGLSWIVTRWYDPAQGRFISEDTLLGDPVDPPSRHLLAYAEGEPVARWDPDGRYWMKLTSTQSLGTIAEQRLGGAHRWAMLWNAQRAIFSTTPARATTRSSGTCLWIPTGWLLDGDDQNYWNTKKRVDCPTSMRHTLTYSYQANGARPNYSTRVRNVGLGDPEAMFSFNRPDLYAATDRNLRRGGPSMGLSEPGRPRQPSVQDWVAIMNRVAGLNAKARASVKPDEEVFKSIIARVWIVNREYSGCGANATGQYIFISNFTRQNCPEILSHEYIHVLQFEGSARQEDHYNKWKQLVGCDCDKHPDEAMGYSWSMWMSNFRKSKEPEPWTVWKR